MNPLSLLNGSARAGGMKDADAYPSRDEAAPEQSAQDSAFARMLNSPSAQDPATQPKPPASATASRRDAQRPRDGDEGARQDAPAKAEGRDDAAPRSERTAKSGKPSDKPTDKPSDKPAEASADGGEDAKVGGSQGSDSAAATATAADSAGAWPPPGLGGFGLMLLQPAAPVAPDAAVAASGNPAAALAPTLLQGDPAPTATAPPASPGIALPGLATPAAAAPAATDTTALAALAAANLAGQAKRADAGSADGATPSVDGPAFVLPNLPHPAAAGRTQDTGTVFSASPTPTPNLHGDGFDEAVGTRLTWLAEQKIGHAHIKITPNDLGPVEVHLQMDGDKVHASFTAAHVEVRQALEQSLPRLRDMLGEHGFQLAHADVGAQQQGQRDGGGNGQNGFNGLNEVGGDDATSVVVPASVLRARGLLDAYA